MRTPWLVSGILIVAIAGFALAEHSYSRCAATVTPIGAGDATLYLVVDEDDDDTWLFEETNGHPSLQRGGHPWYDHSGKTPDMECWDIERATGWEIADPDFIVL